MTPPLPLLLLLLLLLLRTTPARRFPAFRDVTPPSFAAPTTKFGGACVVDLDSDGRPDLLLSHHGAHPVELFFNTGRTFTRAPFRRPGDMHAISPFRATPADPRISFTISRGGAMGNRPLPAEMWAVGPGRRIANVTLESGIGVGGGRGRTAVFMDMRQDGRFSIPDAVVVYADIARCPSCTPPQHHPFRNLGNGTFKPVTIPNITDVRVNHATAVDVDNDGFMELVLFTPEIHIYRFDAPYRAREITKHVLPKSLAPSRPEAFAEADFDNDGDFDLYLADGKTGRKDQLHRGTRGDDVLLENRGGVYALTTPPGIPRATLSHGVTAADFNNDGYIDIYLTIFDAPDVLLRNNGNGSFTRLPGLPRPKGIPGDMAQAVDYDADGRVDIIHSYGDRNNLTFPGSYHVYRNVFRGANRNGYVLVRVGSSPTGSAVSLHAVVRVTAGRTTWMRRVGSPGVAISLSYIELVHVGIGNARVVNVEVTWVNGEKQTLTRVRRGSKLEMGKFGSDVPVRDMTRLRRDL